MAGRVLTVAESDSCGASGVQADIKTVLALGGYAMTAVSAVTAQDTNGIDYSHILDPEFVGQQMRMSLEDIGVDAIKTGMLFSAGIIDAVADVIDDYHHKHIPVVVDPAIVDRKGMPLIDDDAINALKRRLLVRATVLTPNNREAELLTGMQVRDLDDMRHVTDMMLTLGVENVVLKAGNAVAEKVLYLIATMDGERVYERPILRTKHTLGAGCTLSSAIAVSMAQGMGIFESVERGLDFLHQAILHAPGFGSGAGPVNHAFDTEKNSSFFSPEDIKVRQA